MLCFCRSSARWVLRAVAGCLAPCSCASVLSVTKSRSSWACIGNPNPEQETINVLPFLCCWSVIVGRLSVLKCAFWGFLLLFAPLQLFPLLRLFVTLTLNRRLQYSGSIFSCMCELCSKEMQWLGTRQQSGTKTGNRRRDTRINASPPTQANHPARATNGNPPTRPLFHACVHGTSLSEPQKAACRNLVFPIRGLYSCDMFHVLYRWCGHVDLTQRSAAVHSGPRTVCVLCLGPTLQQINTSVPFLHTRGFCCTKIYEGCAACLVCWWWRTCMEPWFGLPLGVHEHTHTALLACVGGLAFSVMCVFLGSLL